MPLTNGTLSVNSSQIFIAGKTPWIDFVTLRCACVGVLFMFIVWFASVCALAIQELQSVEDPDMFVWVDESNKNYDSSKRRRARGLRGQRVHLPKGFPGCNKRCTLIAAANIDGIMMECCQIIECKGSNDRDVTHGTLDAERFCTWVQNKLCPVLGNYVNGEANSVVVMDKVMHSL